MRSCAAPSCLTVSARARACRAVRLTILTIAHRLTTVIDYDQILVMGDGRLLEAGRPADLLNEESSVLSEMTRSTGKAAQAALLARAAAEAR